MKRGRANDHAFMTACPSYEAVYVLNWMSCVCIYLMLSGSFICDVIRLLEHFCCVYDCCSFQGRMFRIFAPVCRSTSLCMFVCASMQSCFSISEVECCGMLSD